MDGAKQEDYVVNIGLDGKCFIEEMTDWNITCFPPKNKPRTNHSDENIAFVIVSGLIIFLINFFFNILRNIFS